MMATFEEEAQDVYARYLEEEQDKPMRYVMHDNAAHDDEALYRLTAEHGMAYYGMYWLLVEFLAGRKGHYYDVSDALGWRKLARDMSCMCDIDVDECRRFITDLYDAGLIIREQYDELHRITSKRLLANAISCAEDVASKRLGAWKTNRKKMMS